MDEAFTSYAGWPGLDSRLLLYSYALLLSQT